MKLKTILLLERGMSMGYGSMSTNDTQLRPTPGGMNDGSPDWDGVVEGKDWFCYMEGNDWNKHRAGISVYITEGDRPHKIWAKIKTGGLRKKGDTNEAAKERVRKHINKVARSWIGEAKRIHNNPEINEVGNPIPITWRAAFLEVLDNPKVKAHLAECGEQAIADPVNFTPRKQLAEADMSVRTVSYSAVVLDDRDRKKLLEIFVSQIPDNWSKYAHHMTIKMGELPPEYKNDIDKQVKLTAYEIGTSDKAVAVKVRGYWTTNHFAHVTLAVNTNEGGKPVDSNKITVWHPLPNTISLSGTVTEIPFNQKKE